MDLFSFPDFEEPKPAKAQKPARGATPEALSVTQLMRRIKLCLELEVGELWIEGEISNLKKQSSGHWYFSLKDAGAQVQCAIFSAKNKKGNQYLADGEQVRVFAETTVYESRGQLQLIIQKIEPAGVGNLQARFEMLKQQLLAEGLFDAERKQTLPYLPQRIGIITSPTGAVIQDMLHVLQRRCPWVSVVLFPVRVQGQGAEQEIAQAILEMSQPEAYNRPRCDVLIVARGGGSLEDLWCFNEEVVARAIAASEIPIISAIGHEVDFTIADFVADLRAPTPSAAAELVSPEQQELLQQLAHQAQRLHHRVQERMYLFSYQLLSFQRGILSKNPDHMLREATMHLDSLNRELEHALQQCIQEKKHQLERVAHQHQKLHPQNQIHLKKEKLQTLLTLFEKQAALLYLKKHDQTKQLAYLLRTLGPQLAFQRGFSITTDEQGNILRNASQAQEGSTIRTRWLEGETESIVKIHHSS